MTLEYTHLQYCPRYLSNSFDVYDIHDPPIKVEIDTISKKSQVLTALDSRTLLRCNSKIVDIEKGTIGRLPFYPKDFPTILFLPKHSYVYTTYSCSKSVNHHNQFGKISKIVTFHENKLFVWKIEKKEVILEKETVFDNRIKDIYCLGGFRILIHYEDPIGVIGIGESKILNIDSGYIISLNYFHFIPVSTIIYPDGKCGILAAKNRKKYTLCIYDKRGELKVVTDLIQTVPEFKIFSHHIKDHYIIITRKTIIDTYFRTKMRIRYNPKTYSIELVNYTSLVPKVSKFDKLPHTYSIGKDLFLSKDRNIIVIWKLELQRLITDPEKVYSDIQTLEIIKARGKIDLSLIKYNIIILHRKTSRFKVLFLENGKIRNTTKISRINTFLPIERNGDQFQILKSIFDSETHKCGWNVSSDLMNIIIRYL